MKERLLRLYRDRKLRRMIAIEIIAITTIAAFFLPGGEDLYRFYRPMAEGCLACGLNPWHTSWILFPLRFIPLRLLWPFWVLFSTSILFYLSEQLDIHPALVLLSFPTLGMIWLGQIDALIALGLFLALTGRSPYLRGVGLLLASIKPQVSGIAILILLLHDRERWKTLIVPGVALFFTLSVWGIDWPLRWIGARPDIAMPVWGLATLFPFGIAAYASIFLFRDTRQQMTAALLATALAVPWFGVYSYVAFLPFFLPWWGLPLSYAWALLYPLLGKESMAYAWILPLGLLITLCLPPLRERIAVRHRLTSVKEEVAGLPLPPTEFG